MRSLFSNQPTKKAGIKPLLLEKSKGESLADLARTSYLQELDFYCPAILVFPLSTLNLA